MGFHLLFFLPKILTIVENLGKLLKCQIVCKLRDEMILQAYGVTIAIAVLVGAFVASLEAKRCGQDSQLIWEALPWVLVLGLVGARAYHVLHFLEFYRENLQQILFLWNGGLGIYGGVFGGLIGFLVWGRGLKGLKGVKMGELLDMAAPGVAIGQAIGRFANFFSQELYGWPTKMPWGIYIAPENRFPGLENFEYFHPLFLYEALWCLLGFVLLLKMGRTGKRLLTGEIFLCYTSFYALGRFFLEGLRIESWMTGGVRVAQLLSILIIGASIILGVLRRTWQNKNPQIHKVHI